MTHQPKKPNTKLDTIQPNTYILPSIDNHIIPLTNNYPPKSPRWHHPIVDNDNILPPSRVTASDKYRKNKKHKVPIYTIKKQQST